MTTNKTIEDMKAELVEAGYSWDSDMHLKTMAVVSSPRGDNQRIFLGVNENDAIRNAYDHLQQERELEALRAFVADIMSGSAMAKHMVKAIELSQKYNITADDESEDDA